MSLSFTTENKFPVGSHPSSVLVKDFNGDDKLDLVVANVNDKNITVLLNDGSGNFKDPYHFTVETTPSSIAMGDIDGDEQDDLVVANADDKTISVLSRDDSGDFVNVAQIELDTKPSAVVVGDIDGDGIVDVVVADAENKNVSVFLNDGMGNFGTPTNISVGFVPSGVVVGDIDGDKKLDLLVANYASGNVSVMLNDGMGSFGAATNFTIGTTSNSVVLEDIDGDGKVDLVLANAAQKQVSVMLNDGKGGFDTATTYTVETSSDYIAVGDIDDDSKPDLVVADADSDSISVLYYNSAPTDLIFGTLSADDDNDGNGDDDDDDDKVIGIISTTDSNKTEKHTYSLVTGTGDTDNDAFIIEEGRLKIKSSATKSVYNIRVRTTDSGGFSFDKDLSINFEQLGFFTTSQVKTTVQLTSVTENIFTVKSKIKGNKAKLSIKIEGSNSKAANEMGVFVVDDAQGRIDGIAPGAVGYAEVALKRAKIVCSAIANAPNGFNLSDLPSLLEFNSGANLRFYMIRNSTSYSVLSGQTSLSEVVFSSATNVSVTSSETEGFSLTWKGLGLSGSDLVVKVKETNQDIPLGIGLQGKHQGEVIDLREVKTKVKAEFVVHREAAYDNLVGFCRIDDADGGIDSDRDGKIDFRPGDAGYIKAMLRARVEGIDLKVNNQGKATFTSNFESGWLFAPFVIANSTVEAILNSNSSDTAVYSPFLGANSDKNNHVRLLGNNCFGFEDQVGAGSDWDFNDLIVQVKLSVTS
ncbi:FG-GAP repeat-containing protein [Calothrix sp. NIES-2100]|uniref:FG-GAP-like repeat-containing protein n=1 Tax=Calothrix sp. NIES-2100 TaxID=1954172 RepID=UPI000B5E85B8|nr:FG-GAP repeat-containing protein [Calothrix sp. NIES-2100]